MTTPNRLLDQVNHLNLAALSSQTDLKLAAADSITDPQLLQELQQLLANNPLAANSSELAALNPSVAQLLLDLTSAAGENTLALLRNELNHGSSSSTTPAKPQLSVPTDLALKQKPSTLTMLDPLLVIALPLIQYLIANLAPNTPLQASLVNATSGITNLNLNTPTADFAQLLTKINGATKILLVAITFAETALNPASANKNGLPPTTTLLHQVQNFLSSNSHLSGSIDVFQAFNYWLNQSQATVTTLGSNSNAATTATTNSSANLTSSSRLNSALSSTSSATLNSMSNSTVNSTLDPTTSGLNLDPSASEIMHLWENMDPITQAFACSMDDLFNYLAAKLSDYNAQNQQPLTTTILAAGTTQQNSAAMLLASTSQQDFMQFILAAGNNALPPLPSADTTVNLYNTSSLIANDGVNARPNPGIQLQTATTLTPANLAIPVVNASATSSANPLAAQSNSVSNTSTVISANPVAAQNSSVSNTAAASLINPIMVQNNSASNTTTIISANPVAAQNSNASVILSQQLSSAAAGANWLVTPSLKNKQQRHKVTTAANAIQTVNNTPTLTTPSRKHLAASASQPNNTNTVLVTAVSSMPANQISLQELLAALDDKSLSSSQILIIKSALAELGLLNIDLRTLTELKDAIEKEQNDLATTAIIAK